MSTSPAPPHYNDIPSKDVKYPTKSYGATPQDTSAAEPLLAAQAGSSRNAWMDQSDDDIPDDFKVGVAVIDCDTEIRMAFIRKVYSILFVQLLLTAVVSVGLYQPKAVEFHQQHPWTIFIPMGGSFVSLLGVYWKRHQHPANLIILGLFTMFESWMIGTITSYYDSKIVSFRTCSRSQADIQVLQALFITVGVFAGLTLFTFQTKVSCAYPTPRA
jgi:FtsH-binding integral membrane protein